jgi:hypothetical protein
MCSEGDISAVVPSGSCRMIQVPEVADCLQPVINIIPLQVCAGFLFVQYLEYPKISIAPSDIYLFFI